MLGVWVCKNDRLAVKMRGGKGFDKRAQIQFVPSGRNTNVDPLAVEVFQTTTLGAITIKAPLFQGKDDLGDILYFLEYGEPPPDNLTRCEHKCLARKVVKYCVVNNDFLCKGKDLILRRVPLAADEIQTILSSFHH